MGKYFKEFLLEFDQIFFSLIRFCWNGNNASKYAGKKKNLKIQKIQQLTISQKEQQMQAQIDALNRETQLLVIKQITDVFQNEKQP